MQVCIIDILTEQNGKQVPEKIGLQPIQKSELSYEFTTVFDLDSDHKASVSKDRTGLFKKEKFIIDTFVGRNVGCSNFVTALQDSLEHSNSFWYLD